MGVRPETMMKLGIEMEFWTIDDDGRLCDGRTLVEASDRFYPEFIESLVEIQTTPQADEATMRRELQRTLRSALRTARESNQQLVPLGTPLTTASLPATTARGELFEQIYGDGVQSAKNCAGTHVHFDGGNVCRQLNLLTALSLVASSPYYCGERRQNCSRAAAYRGACSEPFERFCGLWPYVDDVESWTARVEDAYGTFIELAAERGVSRWQVEDAFASEDTVLNPVHLRPKHGTVEWRAPDTALPSQVLDLAFDVRDLLVQTAEKPLEMVADLEACGVEEDVIRVPEFSVLSALSDEAIEEGLDATRVRSYLDRMGFDTRSYRPLSGGLSGPETLSRPAARRIRLLYAEAFRTDVETLAGPADSLRNLQ